MSAVEVTGFFDDFVRAFASFDGARIAERYAAPYLAVQADGSATMFAKRSDIAAYFQQVVDAYRARGCVACRFADLQCMAMGAAALQASVTWELLAQDGAVLTAWRESYTLTTRAGRWRIHASVDHVQNKE